MTGPLGISEHLWEVLACPCDRHCPVVAGAGASAGMIACTGCERTFPVRDVIPVMLLDEALMPPGPDA